MAKRPDKSALEAKIFGALDAQSGQMKYADLRVQLNREELTHLQSLTDAGEVKVEILWLVGEPTSALYVTKGA